jgi:hypothetical protein
MRPRFSVSRQKKWNYTAYLVVALSVLTCHGCGGAPREERVEATYDKATGKLSQLTLNTNKDGKPNIHSYMDGSNFLRIEIDADEDGKVDRWEYYGPDQKLERVGFSRANDGIADAWAFQGPDGVLQRLEVATRRDGKPNRTEFYEKSVLARAEEDTDADGRVDKWEQYESGTLVSVSFDTTKSGKPTNTVDYRKP